LGQSEVDIFTRINERSARILSDSLSSLH